MSITGIGDKLPSVCGDVNRAGRRANLLAGVIDEISSSTFTACAIEIVSFAKSNSIDAARRQEGAMQAE